MNLSKQNIELWKKRLAIIAEPTLGRDFATALSNEELLEDYTGYSEIEYVNENLEAGL